MAQAKKGDTVRVHYTGKLEDGTVFDSSEGREPLAFTLGEGNVIEGFEDAVVGMTPEEITDLVHGDTITEVLNYVQFDAQALIATFRRKVQRASTLSRQEANAFIADYIEGLAGYTYLEGDVTPSG